nr:hypothetical protein Iba_chr12eCG13650 [Ipomoea batatas]
MKLVICGVPLKRLDVNLSPTTMRHHLHLQSKMDLRQGRLFLMFMFTSSLAKVVTSRKMMKFMMLWTKKRRS